MVPITVEHNDSPSQHGSRSLRRGRVRIRKLRSEDRERVCKFLRENLNAKINEADWLRIMTYSWYPERPFDGMIALDGEKIVGFAGAIFSKRNIDGKLYNFCNLSTWVVIPEMRSYSLKLRGAVLAAKGYSFTNISPNPKLQTLFRVLGFRELETCKLFFLPLLNIGTMLNERVREKTTDIEQIVTVVTEADVQILDDHRLPDCLHFLIRDATGYCYGIAKRRRRKGISFAEILYVSSRERLRLHLEEVKWLLLRRHGVFLTAIDLRLFGPPPPITFQRRLKSPYLYKIEGNSLRPEQIDNLYSELALLPN